MNRVNVTPVVSQTSSKIGALVLGRFIGGASTALERSDVCVGKPGIVGEKAPTAPTSTVAVAMDILIEYEGNVKRVTEEKLG
mmetsp:Transcript_10354/g.15235  ORF Transcript_10354/g.15235 Transcript_10354/m.15235 type:complete len:82 (-) Transcript_10354:157-402(-)